MFSDADIGNNPNMLDFAKLFGIDNLGIRNLLCMTAQF